MYDDKNILFDEDGKSIFTYYISGYSYTRILKTNSIAVHKIILILLAVYILNTPICIGQDADVYSLDRRNGLSTNHVYISLVDATGYLWLGTNDGVYRYNGYELQRYDYNTGLHNNDIWNLYEDSNGQIWVGSISTGFGYIKNGNYHDIYIKKPDSNFLVYPFSIQEFNDTLSFIDRSRASISELYLCVIASDTLSVHSFKKPDTTYGAAWLIMHEDNIITFFHNGVVAIKERKNVVPKHKIGISESDTILHTQQSLLDSLSFYSKNNFFKNYLFYTSHKHKQISFFNLSTKTDTIFTFNSENESIEHCYPLKDSLYIITNKYVYICDSTLKSRRYDIAKNFPQVIHANLNYLYFTNNALWGKCLSTDNAGTFISFNTKNNYKRPETTLTNYRFLGMGNDSLGFWYNKQKSTLISMVNGKRTNAKQIPTNRALEKAISVNSYRSILLSSQLEYWVDNTTCNLSTFLGNYKTLVLPNKDTTLNIDFQNRNLTTSAFLNLKYILCKSPYVFYTSGGDIDRVCKVYLNPENQSLLLENIYDGKYIDIAYNPYNASIIPYSEHSLTIIDSNDKPVKHFSQSQLKSIGIQGIEHVYADEYGNVFIKDKTHFFLFDVDQNTTTKLFTEFNLRSVKVQYAKNKICLAGDFGVLTTYSEGKGELAAPTVYPNTKKLLYNYVTDLQYSTNNILLNTDNGSYIISTQNDKNANTKKPREEYRIALAHDDLLYRLSKNDTIYINNNTKSITVDLIRPTGTGVPKFRYIINGVELGIEGNELVLPKLSAGKYYEASIIASDDVWISKPLQYYIYIQPKWWETTQMKVALFILLLALLGLIIFIAINTTRKIVNRNNEKRTRERELELKSIYSQINPHFIFNTLGTAQYFIKKKQNADAEEHISRFSELLRSYISSSRNKYITIGAEIENLYNYLELQLSRFGEKFKYKIECDEEIKNLKIPSMLLQPIVENAINHGLFHKTEQGHLNISFSEDTDKHELICIVDDDGIGRVKSKELKTAQMKKATSYGTVLIKELINTINKYEPISITLKYIDKTPPETGTTVIITITNYNNAQ